MTERARQFAVVLKGQGVIWGPFSSREEAYEFAKFATAEIDPAEVRYLNPAADELLRWRRAAKERADG